MSIKKYFIAFVLGFIVCINGNGQSLDRNTPSAKNYFPEKTITVRFNFTGLIDPFDQNISIGAEYKLNAHWSTGGDIAYIFRSFYLSESKHANGFMLRPFLRYYPKNNQSGFFEAEINYKYVSYQLTDWIGKDATNGVPAYEEFATFHYNKRVFGLNLKAGTDVNLSRDKKWRLEFYLGLGIRFKNQGADIGTYARQLGLFPGLYNPQYSTIVVPMGTRLVYDIK